MKDYIINHRAFAANPNCIQVHNEALEQFKDNLEIILTEKDKTFYTMEDILDSIAFAYDMIKRPEV